MERKRKVYTKTGDDGKTFTLSGERVEKNDIRIEVCGEIDELVSWLGVITSHLDDINSEEERKKTKDFLLLNQSRFLDITVMIMGNKNRDVGNWTDEVEKEIDDIESKLGTIKNFLLPGGSKLASFTHVARSVCRRLERRIVEISSKSSINPDIKRYVNRFSDYLFVLARYFNYLLGINDEKKK
ncbi:MAG: cob(I)yrinic acid a,c-diamide adenosyltransferase [Brevinematia bacterium]